MHEGDGSTTYSQECTNRDCPDGPSGLFTERVRNKSTGRVVSTTQVRDAASFRHAAQGDPSKNETNVEAVARTLMAAANRQYGTQYDQFVAGPSGALAERGFDCEIVASQAGYRLRLQVTRALPPEVYREQQEQHERQLSGTFSAAGEWVMDAVLRKEVKASPDVALVIDGVDAPFLRMFSDPADSAEKQARLEAQAWHSIWVVGHSGAKHLAGRGLP
jgi:hypothetical protein